jgi:hypothetical protein
MYNKKLAVGYAVMYQQQFIDCDGNLYNDILPTSEYFYNSQHEAKKAAAAVKEKYIVIEIARIEIDMNVTLIQEV